MIVLDATLSVPRCWRAKVLSVLVLAVPRVRRCSCEGDGVLVVRCDNCDLPDGCARQKDRTLRGASATTSEISQDFAQTDSGTIPAIGAAWHDVTKT